MIKLINIYKRFFIVMSLIEDTSKMKQLYTETSQYRNWHFTKEKLQETRNINHDLAVSRVKKKILEESVCY